MLALWNILEGRNPRLHRCENMKTRVGTCFLCGTTKSFNKLIHVKFHLHVTFRRLIASCTQRELGFESGPVRVRYVVDKGALGHIPLLLSFHQCYILIFILYILTFIYMLLLPERVISEAWIP